MNSATHSTTLLRFEDIAGRQPWHASLYQSRPGEGATHALHGQDFFEFMLVVVGGGQHLINGAFKPLRTGDLILVRPGDVHGFEVTGSDVLHFFNIAFPASSWLAFGDLIQQEAQFACWRDAVDPPCTWLAPDQTARLAANCQAMVEAFLDEAQAIHLCRFWCSVFNFLLPSSHALRPASPPPDWLQAAVTAMGTTENLLGGLPRFLELAHVSQGHLCRCVRASYGCSPTQLITHLRLRLAARLLVNTFQSPEHIGAACGFENASYFYRCFRQRHGQTPRTYRTRARTQAFLGEP